VQLQHYRRRQSWNMMEVADRRAWEANFPTPVPLLSVAADLQLLSLSRPKSHKEKIAGEYM
jgi:hypothetical protein